MQDRVVASLVLVVLGSCSACFAFAVVLTGILFPDLISSRDRPLSYVIFLSALCDFFADIGLCMGFAKAGSNICVFQSIMVEFFFPASWIWMVILVHQLHDVIIYKKLWLRPMHMHSAVWPLSFLFLFLC